jgi:hypothetical protein
LILEAKNSLPQQNKPEVVRACFLAPVACSRALAGNITGMLLAMGNGRMVLLCCWVVLAAKMNEVLEVLWQRNAAP